MLLCEGEEINRLVVNHESHEVHWLWLPALPALFVKSSGV